MTRTVMGQVREALSYATEPMSAAMLLELVPAADTSSQVHAALGYLVKKGEVDKQKEAGKPVLYRMLNSNPVPPIAAPTNNKKKVEKKPKRKPAEEPQSDSQLGHVKPSSEATSQDDSTVREIRVGSTLKQRKEYLQLALDRAQQTIDEYLAEVADPAILDPLMEMRNLALKRLNQVTGDPPDSK